MVSRTRTDITYCDISDPGLHKRRQQEEHQAHPGPYLQVIISYVNQAEIYSVVHCWGSNSRMVFMFRVRGSTRI